MTHHAHAASAGFDQATCTAEETRKAFLGLAELATPRLRDWARDMAVSHTKHYSVVLRFAHRLREKAGIESVLDVGSVPGFVPVTLAARGLHAEAVDIAPERCAGVYATQSVRCHKVDIERERLPFEDATWDLVLFKEVLEHLRVDPISALREVSRVVKEGGSVLLSTPNITLPMRHRFLLGRDYQGDVVREFSRLESVGHMGHIRLYSRNEVRRLLRHVGLQELDSFVIAAQQPGGLVRRLLTRLIPEQMGSHLYVAATKQSGALQ